MCKPLHHCVAHLRHLRNTLPCSRCQCSGDFSLAASGHLFSAQSKNESRRVSRSRIRKSEQDSGFWFELVVMSSSENIDSISSVWLEQSGCSCMMQIGQNINKQLGGGDGRGGMSCRLLTERADGYCHRVVPSKRQPQGTLRISMSGGDKKKKRWSEGLLIGCLQ